MIVEYTAYIRFTDPPNACEIESGRDIVHLEIPSGTPRDEVPEAIQEVLDSRGFGSAAYQVMAFEAGYFEDADDLLEGISEREELEAEEQQDIEADAEWAEHLIETGAAE